VPTRKQVSHSGNLLFNGKEIVNSSKAACCKPLAVFLD